jgi:hypothetical protein
VTEHDAATSVFSTTWVHVFEQDTAEGAVFCRESGDIPLSRRPRERIELLPDGKATLLMPGPDDRFVGEPATWREEGDTLVVRDARDTIRVRVIARSADRLVVRLSHPTRS